VLDRIRYRSATPRDATIMAEVIAEGFATYREFAPPRWLPRRSPQEEGEVYSRLNRGDVHARIAFSDGAAVGVTGWMPALSRPERLPIPGRAHLWILFVRTEWWGTGLAAALLEWSVAGMRESGRETAQLWTPRDSPRARAFYEREGWTASGEEVFNEDLGLDVVLYERRL
jgi:GNAT superfamily N-acetyltransferase